MSDWTDCFSNAELGTPLHPGRQLPTSLCPAARQVGPLVIKLRQRTYFDLKAFAFYSFCTHQLGRSITPDDWSLRREVELGRCINYTNGSCSGFAMTRNLQSSSIIIFFDELII